MNNRSIILEKVKKNQPAAIPHPGSAQFPIKQDLIERFGVALSNIGGELRLFEDYKAVEEAVLEIEGNGENNHIYIKSESNYPSLPEPDTTIITGEWAVAENAAVYVNVDLLPHRSVPFLGYRLIVLVPKANLCYNLHHAYQAIEVANLGFGIFIAGPSATADIAQVLVRGAHGPSKMEVWMFGDQ